MKEIEHWATSYALTASQLYYRFPDKKYISIYEDFDYGTLHRLYGRILRYFFYLVIIDIIENSITFKFPPGTRARLEMVPVSGEDFVKARQNGAFQDVDFLASNFTGYQLNLTTVNKYGKWHKRIYVSSKYRDRITELTNQGKGW